MTKILLSSLMIFSLAAKNKKISFNEQIRPILSEKCYYCHGPDAEDIKGHVQLHTFENVTQKRSYKSRSGKVKTLEPVIIPGDPENSLLFELVTTDDEDDIMPPKKRHMPVTKEEIETLKQWIIEGAEYEKLWSFQPLLDKVDIPTKSADIAKNPIDNFVQKKLEENDLSFAPEADENILLRRLYLTLTGLVPTPTEIAKFKNEKSIKAYENTVDELLKSKACAEHLAVEWMDVARYADSYGYQTDRGRQVWPYRDWILRAFDKNLPYDQFIHQQLAGDMMPNPTDDMRLATAFNRMHMQKNEGGSVPEEFRTEYVADRAQTAATAFMGMTMECARCHDHKYDPLSQEDYFKTFALFNNIDEAGLYSFFTNAIPSPSMPILNEHERKTLKQNETTLKNTLNYLDHVRKTQHAQFLEWQKTWNKKVELKSLIAEFDFAKTKGHKVPNSLNKKQEASFNGAYNKLVNDERGKVLLLDGDAEVKFGDIGPYERHKDFSFSLWINTPVEHSRAVILHRSKAWTDAASRGYELMMDEGRLSFALIHFSPGDEARIRTFDKIPINTWKQVAVTYDGSSKANGIKIYVDGELQKTEILKDKLTKEIYYTDPKNIARTIEANKKITDPKKKKKVPKKADLLIGARMRDMGFKNSKVDDLRFFDRRLSKLQIRENFQANSQAGDDEELYDYYLTQINPEYQKAYKSVLTRRFFYNDYYNKRFHIMVMEEMKKPRTTYVLKRGLYSTPDLERTVEPGPPVKIFPFGDEYSRDRLGFAKWLTHPNHPLTARVTVNRYWQMIFGRGLVATTNDFGSQADYPSHPQLLDYLARYFIDHEWDLKGLLKHIVMSHTFRQSSASSATLREIDPENKLLARGPVNHMTSEMLRDNTLYTADLINIHFGGGSVPAHQIWKNKYRRSLYTYWKRNDPNPEMLIFGTPRRQICSVKREKTSTPLQALVLMNSPLVSESAKSTAFNLLIEQSDDVVRINKLYNKLAGKDLNTKELEILNDLLNTQRQYFKNNSGAANEYLGQGKVKVDLSKFDKVELASWAVLANTIINLDSFYMVR